MAAGFWSSSYEFELTEIERTSYGLRVSFQRTEPDGDATMDAAPHSTVIRITDEKTGIPEQVLVQVDGDDASKRDVL